MSTTHSNDSTLIFLVNQDVRAVAVTYEKIDVDQDTTKMAYEPEYLEAGRKLPKGATVFKTMDPDIKINDFVVVPTETRHGMTVCQVVAVDFEIDYTSSKEVHWVVDKIDTAPFEETRQTEADMIGKVRQARVGEERRKLRDTMLASLGGAALDGIPMITAGSTNGEVIEGEAD